MVAGQGHLQRTGPTGLYLFGPGAVREGWTVQGWAAWGWAVWGWGEVWLGGSGLGGKGLLGGVGRAGSGLGGSGLGGLGLGGRGLGGSGLGGLGLGGLGLGGLGLGGSGLGGLGLGGWGLGGLGLGGGGLGGGQSEHSAGIMKKANAGLPVLLQLSVWMWLPYQYVTPWKAGHNTHIWDNGRCKNQASVSVYMVTSESSCLGAWVAWRGWRGWRGWAAGVQCQTQGGGQEPYGVVPLVMNIRILLCYNS